MAQHKYDLLTVSTAADCPTKYQPWYKERLRLKFIKQTSQAAAFNRKRWTFLANDIDDCRTGVPSKTKGKSMIKREHMVNVPLISSGPYSEQKGLPRYTRHPESEVISKNKSRLGTLYSRMGPRTQLQQECLEREESPLLKNFYSHLKDSIPVELQEDILGVINCGSGLKRGSSSSPQVSKDEIKTPVPTQSKEADESISRLSSPSMSSQQEHSSVRSRCERPELYKFPLKKTTEEKDRETVVAANQRVISARQQSRVDHVTRGLVQWMEDMGKSADDEYTMNEATIKSLFSSDYESRLILASPFHKDAPTEHRSNPSSPSFSSPSATQHTRARTSTCPANILDSKESRYIRTKYGSWYLPVELWSLKYSNETLRDRKEIAAEMDNEESIKCLAMNQMLSTLHGTKSFKEFIITKKPRSKIPSFLEQN